MRARIILLVLLFFSIVSCIRSGNGKETPNMGVPANISANPSPSPSPSTNTFSTTTQVTPPVQPLLRFTLKSAWEGTSSSLQTKADCQIPAGSPAGTQVNCSATFDEAELYYSRFTIDLRATKDTCKVIKFAPYYYQASSSASFTPTNATTSVNCNGNLSTLPTACFGGFAKEIISSFPQATVQTDIPSGTWSRSYSIPSSHSKGVGNNRRMANDLVDRQNPISLPGDGYAGGNTMQDYQLLCLNSSNQLSYSIKLTVSQNPGAGSIKSWTGLPIPPAPATPPPISVQFSTFTANDSAYLSPTTQQTCAVTTGNSANCTFNYPEAQLYYSNMRVSVSIPPNICDYFRIYPYYYRASNSTGFRPEWPVTGNSGLNCYGPMANVAPECFSGAALAIIPQGPSGQNSFPENTYLTYFPGSSSYTMSWDVPAAFNAGRKSNRWMANNFPLTDRNGQVVVQGDGYAGSSQFQDYLFNCYQNDGTLKHSVQVNVVPNSATTFPDWTSVPAVQPPPMSVQVATYWQDDITKQNPTQHPNPPVALTATNTTPNPTYNIEIPSGQLYYSQLQFTLSVPSNTCQIINFNPYYYLASNGAYLPNWSPGTTTPIDCLKNGIRAKEIDCYNGPAKPILEAAGVSFPAWSGINYLPAGQGFGQNWTAPSANSQGRLNNQYTSNTLLDRLNENSIGTGYAGNFQMQDWRMECRNTANELLYSIQFNIVPVFSNGSPDIGSSWMGL